MFEGLDMVQDIGTIWPKVLDELKKRVTEQQFKTWFSHLEPEGLRGAKVELRVPGPIYKDWLARRYKPLLEVRLPRVCTYSLYTQRRPFCLLAGHTRRNREGDPCSLAGLP